MSAVIPVRFGLPTSEIAGYFQKALKYDVKTLLKCDCGH